MSKTVGDDELSRRVDLFINNAKNSGMIDEVFMITSRGDRVGLHTTVQDMEMFFKALEFVLANKERLLANHIKANDE